jgi:glycosyltransferase involved in cell wall biosynthesis
VTICFDIRALQIGHENRGIGMFIKSTLEHLPKQDNTNYIFYAFDKNNPIEELGIEFKNNYQLIQTPTLKTALGSPVDIVHFLRLQWHSFQKIKPLEPDVFVQFDFNLSIPKWKRTKKVVIAYDLIPLIKKNEYLPGLRFAWQHSTGKKAKLRALARSGYYRFKYWLGYRVYKKADSVISISDATARSFTDLLGIPKSKIHTMYLAPVLPIRQDDETQKNKFNKPYIFYIGGTDSRKRIEDLRHAFNIAKGRGSDLDLVLAGNEFKSVTTLPNIVVRNAILESPYKKDIHLIGFVNDSEKMALYRSAYAFIFCTTYEGFGLPIVEAMSAGCPVISYDNSSIPEAAGEAALLVDTGNYVAIANKIMSLRDPELRKTLIDKGAQQSNEFTWEDTATRFLFLIKPL